MQHQQAFEKLKKDSLKYTHHIAPLAGKELLIYLAASEEAISVLIAQEVEGQERPVYYQAHRLCVALMYVVTKLRHYMVTHKVKVITHSDPIKLLLQKPILTGRYAKWILMLSELDLTVEKPKAIKSQALVDLLKYSKQEEQVEEVLLVDSKEENWVLYFDGASSKYEGSARVIISNDK